MALTDVQVQALIRLRERGVALAWGMGHLGFPLSTINSLLRKCLINSDGTNIRMSTQGLALLSEIEKLAASQPILQYDPSSEPEDTYRCSQYSYMSKQITLDSGGNIVQN